jgi:hypothetical protein
MRNPLQPTTILRPDARGERTARGTVFPAIALIGALASAIAGAVVMPAQAQAGNPTAASALDATGTFGLRANGGSLHTVQSSASPGADAASVRFIGSAVDPGGKWEASWDYQADLDPTGNAKLTGSATIVNKAAEAIDFDLSFEVPICPFIQSASRMGGSCTIKLTTNANGGAISCLGGNAVFTALADGASGGKIFHGPFNMGSTGSGTAQTANLFGAPFPAMVSAAVTSQFGIRHVFKLTDGDSVLITSNLVVGGEPANFVVCDEGPATSGQAAASGNPEGASNAPNAVIVASSAGGVTTSAIKLGASPSNKVMISGDKKKSSKKPAASSNSKSKSKSAASAQQRRQSQAGQRSSNRSPWSRPSPWRR